MIAWQDDEYLGRASFGSVTSPAAPGNLGPAEEPCISWCKKLSKRIVYATRRRGNIKDSSQIPSLFLPCNVPDLPGENDLHVEMEGAS